MKLSCLNNSNKTGRTSIRHERRTPEGNAIYLNVEMLTFEVRSVEISLP